ncbi:Exocyst complex component sec15 [Lasiodiplodia theobromae]|uniref:Exocyst complex component sec15 n=1 Tax=Lasiodiplodia theobromae TaxID=45133 RepID=UPI0015C35B8A|nr:Exocyst complex component sec15 [Lasiodiplodia theobromae]KAF4545544.1 Exocyst complex component sec15 [Lasiodiplodia theobromae]
MLDASVRFAKLDEIRQQTVDRRAQHYEEFPAKEKIWKAPRKNDLVLLRNFALDSQKGKKFMPRWRGPYLIDRITATERSAELKDLQTDKIIGPHHINNLKLYVARDEQSDHGSWKTLVKNDLELANEWAQIKDVQQEKERTIRKRQEREPLLRQELEMHGSLPPYFVPFHVNDYQYQKMKYEVKMARTPESDPLKFMIEYHPLSNSGMNCYLEPRSVREPRPPIALEEPGFGRPPLEYVATDWSWRRFYDPNEALYEALKTSRMAAKQPVPSYESFERVLRRVNDERGTLFVDDRPTPYQPKDQAFQLLPHEPYLAHVARQFRVSIAIAQPFGHSDSLDLLGRSTFRKELYPLIFMRRFMNIWYALSARDPDIYQVIANPDVPLLIHNLWDEFCRAKDGILQDINHAIETNDKAFKVMLENVTAIAMMEDTSNI